MRNLDGLCTRENSDGQKKLPRRKKKMLSGKCQTNVTNKRGAIVFRKYNNIFMGTYIFHFIAKSWWQNDLTGTFWAPRLTMSTFFPQPTKKPSIQ